MPSQGVDCELRTGPLVTHVPGEECYLCGRMYSEHSHSLINKPPISGAIGRAQTQAQAQVL